MDILLYVTHGLSVSIIRLACIALSMLLVNISQ